MEKDVATLREPRGPGEARPRDSPTKRIMFHNASKAETEAAFSPSPWFQVPGRLVLPATWNQEPPKVVPFPLRLRWHVTPAAALTAALIPYPSVSVGTEGVLRGRMPALCSSAMSGASLSRTEDLVLLIFLLALRTTLQFSMCFRFFRILTCSRL